LCVCCAEDWTQASAHAKQVPYCPATSPALSAFMLQGQNLQDRDQWPTESKSLLPGHLQKKSADTHCEASPLPGWSAGQKQGTILYQQLQYPKLSSPADSQQQGWKLEGSFWSVF
jgi:hypothetical protein